MKTHPSIWTKVRDWRKPVWSVCVIPVGNIDPDQASPDGTVQQASLMTYPEARRVSASLQRYRNVARSLIRHDPSRVEFRQHIDSMMLGAALSRDWATLDALVAEATPERRESVLRALGRISLVLDREAVKTRG